VTDFGVFGTPQFYSWERQTDAVCASQLMSAPHNETRAPPKGKSAVA